MPNFPEIGGIAFSVMVAAVIEILKWVGVFDENMAPWVNIVAGVVWVAALGLLGLFPAYEQWFVMALQIILAFASVVGGAHISYKLLVQPATRKRFNAYDREM